MGAVFDCNNFPLETGGAVAELIVEADSAVVAAWGNAPHTQTSVVGGELHVNFLACRVRLPEVLIPADTVLDARMGLTLPAGAVGSFVLDLTAVSGTRPIGGVSFGIVGDPPPG